MDQQYCAKYTAAMRQSYSLFYQLAKISAARGALVHDDRADALEGLCRHFQAAIAQDQKAGLARAQAKAHAELIKDPCGHNRCRSAPSSTNRPSMLRRRR